MRLTGSGRVPEPYRGQASAVFCLGVFIDTMITQALADDPYSMKAFRP